MEVKHEIIKIQLIAFGIAKDILGAAQLNLEFSQSVSVADLKKQLIEQYPSFAKLSHFQIAVDESYVQDNHMISGGEEIAIIPPVSGG